MTPRKILLGHGSGGLLMHELIRELLLPRLRNPILERLSDSAPVDLEGPAAFTTDSFVVSPLFFPGADIGKLAVCGTINDLVVQGAQPRYLSLAFIIEEGLEYKTLEQVVGSIARTCAAAGVQVVTGDLKVVERGACDKLFINTAGIGRIVFEHVPSTARIRTGDALIVTGDIGRHGLAVLSRRGELETDVGVASDCASLHGLILPLRAKSRAVRFMRDPTRGGLATTLNEIAQETGLAISVDETRIPVSAKVRAACELLGIDPLYMPCEGRAILVVRPDAAQNILAMLRRHPLGRRASLIGTVQRKPASCVVLRTVTGTERIVDMLTSEALPRIC